MKSRYQNLSISGWHSSTRTSSWRRSWRTTRPKLAKYCSFTKSREKIGRKIKAVKTRNQYDKTFSDKNCWIVIFWQKIWRRLIFCNSILEPILSVCKHRIFPKKYFLKTWQDLINVLNLIFLSWDRLNCWPIVLGDPLN